jgi:hypothetical protein
MLAGGQTSGIGEARRRFNPKTSHCSTITANQARSQEIDVG